MSRLVLDAPLLAKLNGLREQLELCDETGETVAVVLPAEQFWKLQLAADDCPYSYEELREALRESGGSSLQEIWRSLGRS